MRKGYTYVRLPYKAGYNELLADQKIQAGEPCIRGTRIPASSLYGYYKAGDNIKTIHTNFPYVTIKQIKAAIDYVDGK